MLVVILVHFVTDIAPAVELLRLDETNLSLRTHTSRIRGHLRLWLLLLLVPVLRLPTLPHFEEVSRPDSRLELRVALVLRIVELHGNLGVSLEKPGHLVAGLEDVQE